MARGRLDCFVAVAPRNDGSCSIRSETAPAAVATMSGAAIRRYLPPGNITAELFNRSNPY